MPFNICTYDNGQTYIFRFPNTWLHVSDTWVKQTRVNTLTNASPQMRILSICRLTKLKLNYGPMLILVTMKIRSASFCKAEFHVWWYFDPSDAPVDVISERQLCTPFAHTPTLQSLSMCSIPKGTSLNPAPCEVESSCCVNSGRKIVQLYLLMWAFKIHLAKGANTTKNNVIFSIWSEVFLTVSPSLSALRRAT